MCSLESTEHADYRWIHISASHGLQGQDNGRKKVSTFVQLMTFFGAYISTHIYLLHKTRSSMITYLRFKEINQQQGTSHMHIFANKRQLDMSLTPFNMG